MPTYDVLKEPWIPVEDFTGNRMELGILEVLQECSGFERFNETSPVLEYGMYRFLIAFLMDVYRPASLSALEDIFAAGCFDMEMVDRYIEQCKSEGCSFDLLDAKSPFLQAPFNSEYDKNLKSVAELFVEIPTGNNATHFDHHSEDVCEMAYKDCVKALTSLTAFSVAGTGRLSTVNGAPPLYFAIKGNNLFESLVLGMIPLSQIKGLQFDDPPVLWRNHDIIVPGKEVAETSYLFGLTFPCRRALLIPSENTPIIRQVYFQKGLRFLGFDGWTDPHVAYSTNEKGRSSIKPRLSKEVWREIGNIFMLTAGAPAIVKNYESITERGAIPIVTYSFVTSQASYEHWQRGDLVLDYEIARDEAKMQILAECIQIMELYADSYLSFAIKNVESGSQKGSLFNYTLQSYYSNCRNQFFSNLCPRLRTSSDYAEVRVEWAEYAMKQTLDRFEELVGQLGNDAKHLISSATGYSNLKFRLLKHIKGVKQDGKLSD